MPKTLFTKQPTYAIGITMLNIVKNIKTFSDKIKVIFEQKGYVAKSNIVANVALKPTPLVFKGQ